MSVTVNKALFGSSRMTEKTLITANAINLVTFVYFILEELWR